MRRGFLLLFAVLPAAASRLPAPKLPVYFEENRGQQPEAVRFLSRGAGADLFLTHDGVEVAGAGRKWRMTFVAGRTSSPEGLDPLAARSNYLLGNDPRRWRLHVPHYARVRYQNVYPGIDVIFYGNAGREMEYDFVAAPGADASRIRLELSGPGKVVLTAQGELHWGPLRFRRPVAYQEIDGERRPVECRWMLGRNQAGFALGAHDPSRPLVIDPVLSYSSYLGGTGGSSAEAMAVDAQGNIYLTGTTASNHFPIANPAQEFFFGSNEVFVTKLDPTGSTLVYSTYLGSWGDDRALGIAVDAAGAAYVTGFTSSPEFPLHAPLQGAYGGGSLVNGGDAFVFKLNPEGSALEWSTFFGGSADEFARAIAIDRDGNILIAGSTNSFLDFPLVRPLQENYGGGTRDAFLLKLNPTGAEVLFSTFLGGGLVDEGNAIAVGAQGDIYFTGTTTSLDFPTHQPFQATYRGGARDIFIARIKADGSAFFYSTYLGSTGDDFARAIAVDSAGHAYITGYANSSSFPNRNPIQTALRGGRDVFLTRFNPEGSALVYSTLLGGSNNDEGFGVALDNNGDIYVTGLTQSLNYPAVNSFHGANGGACTRAPCTNDVFVTKWKADGRKLLYSTYLGGTAAEQPRAIVIDPEGTAWVAGQTASVNFPAVVAFQADYRGGGPAVAFVSRIQ